MYLEIRFSCKAKIPFSLTRLLALRATYSVILTKFATFLIDQVSGAKVRAWIIYLFVFIVEGFSFISCISLSKFSALICNKSTSSVVLVSKLISFGVTFNALATFSSKVEVAVSSFLLPKICPYDLVQCCIFTLYS